MQKSWQIPSVWDTTQFYAHLLLVQRAWQIPSIWDSCLAFLSSAWENDRFAFSHMILVKRNGGHSRVTRPWWLEGYLEARWSSFPVFPTLLMCPQGKVSGISKVQTTCSPGAVTPLKLNSVWTLHFFWLCLPWNPWTPVLPLNFISHFVITETIVTVRDRFRIHPSLHSIPLSALYKTTRQTSLKEPSHPLPCPRPPSDLFPETQHLPSVFNRSC